MFLVFCQNAVYRKFLLLLSADMSETRSRTRREPGPGVTPRLNATGWLRDECSARAKTFSLSSENPAESPFGGVFHRLLTCLNVP